MSTDLFGQPIADPPPMNAPLPWRVFQMNDHPEWWIARTLEEAKAAVAEAWGDDDPELVVDAFELSDESLSAETLTDDEADPPVKRTFREELDLRIARGLAAPEFFAAVE